MASSSTSPPRSAIPIDQLVVTQYGYRKDAGVLAMTDYVKHGGLFTVKPPIILFKMDDDRLYIHDGHHRSMAIYLSGRTYLDESEYEINSFSFSKLAAPNFGTGFVTPYDPRTEMRLSDFRVFKKTALQYYNDQSNPNHEIEACRYIEANRPLYCVTHRPYETIPEMVVYLGLKAEYDLAESSPKAKL